LDLRRDEQLAGVDPRIDRVRLMETTKMLIREQAEKVVGCTLASVMRSVKVAMLSGLVIDRFKGEVDFIPRNRYLKVEGRPDKKIKELWADPNYRGMIHYVANTGEMSKPPFVECVYEGEQFEFVGESDELRIKHTKDPLNEHRAKGDTSKIHCVYSRWYLKSGTVDHVMTWQQILEHRDKYSKSFQDAEKYKKFDSFWHKEPIKAAMKTLIRDAVNRDKVPISRIDRGYILDAQRAEQEEWMPTDVVDAEFSAVDAGQAVESDAEPEETSTAMIEAAASKKPQVEQQPDPPAVPLTAEQSIERFNVLLGHAGSMKECGDALDWLLPPDDSNPHKLAGAQQKACVAAFQSRQSEVRSK
jgi:recombinational DNA repair protein RecT